MTDFCPVCSTPSSSFCANCKKVAYCGKDHQKQHRKTHKTDCYPALIKAHPVLGHHLATTRDILSGEKIFKEEPLIIGPRSNLFHFQKICLGCCDQINETSNYNCSQCKWPVCNVKCEQNPKHSKFECSILSDSKVPPAKTQEEYLCITFLRCVLLKRVDPVRWEELLTFESHVETRKAKPICVEQSHFAVYFIRDLCKLVDIDPKIIDFVYGIIIVNGYGDPSTFCVKLYSKAAKLSHACIPNTRTLLDSKGLEVLGAVPIKAGQPLTQLYGRMFKGTHRRQELLQNIYYFSCSCNRCKDPSELGTYFSAIKCPAKSCVGYLLPKNPLDISTTSKWKCDKCTNSTSFVRCVVPALTEITKEAGTDENDGLYCEYEVYQEDNPNVPSEGDYAKAWKVQYVQNRIQVLQKLQTKVVHKNHYALLPLKTALVATIHSLLLTIEDNDVVKGLLEDFLRFVKELLEVVEILLPGITSERGLLLFYLSEGMRISILKGKPGPLLTQLQEQLKSLQKEALKIMLLETEDDSHRELVLKHIQA